MYTAANEQTRVIQIILTIWISISIEIYCTTITFEYLNLILKLRYT